MKKVKNLYRCKYSKEIGDSPVRFKRIPALYFTELKHYDRQTGIFIYA